MDSWYQTLCDRYGEEFCRIAGYFEETKPWTETYQEVFDLPTDSFVIQISGAFHPFHRGHLEMIDVAVQATAIRRAWSSMPLYVVVHADHSEYRNSKGTYDHEEFIRSFDILSELKDRMGLTWQVILEDDMPNGCSRNFTRLYSELESRNNAVWFLCGGDRANFALTFMDSGRCIVSGRDQSPIYQKYRYLDRLRSEITFVPGNNLLSSTEIRNKK